MNKVSKNLKPIFIITILYVAVLAIFIIVKSMTVAEAMFMCLPNNISIKAALMQLPRTGPLYT
jgi:hypothetical protein